MTLHDQHLKDQQELAARQKTAETLAANIRHAEFVLSSIPAHDEAAIKATEAHIRQQKAFLASEQERVTTLGGPSQAKIKEVARLLGIGGPKIKF